MGLAPLTWQEIQAFKEVNELELTLFEIQWLREMSDAYCTEYSKATDPQRKAPYAPYVEAEEMSEAQAIEQAISWRSAIRSQAKGKT